LVSGRQNLMPYPGPRDGCRPIEPRRKSVWHEASSQTSSECIRDSLTIYVGPWVTNRERKGNRFSSSRVESALVVNVCQAKSWLARGRLARLRVPSQP